MCTSQYHLWKKTGNEQLFLYVLTAWSDSLQGLLDTTMIAVTFIVLMGIYCYFSINVTSNGEQVQVGAEDNHIHSISWE